MKNEFWIIEEDRIGDFETKERKILNCEGPFYSMSRVKQKLREVCSADFIASDHDNLEKETYESFCSKFKIVQTITTIHPIPVVNIKIKLGKLE